MLETDLPVSTTPREDLGVPPRYRKDTREARLAGGGERRFGVEFLERELFAVDIDLDRRPSGYRPLSNSAASGFWISCWITRFSGRAPNTGS